MSIAIDSKSCVIDGRRQLLLSGAIHYPRSTPAMWPALMKAAREGGLNCVETYVCWGQHERSPGQYDFSGRRDLRRFCECAADEGLKIFLRPGPYICAEQDYGGFPAWLRDVPGIRLRTKNDAYYEKVRQWFDILFAYLTPLFDKAGGPIIALQVENEYANIGSAYGDSGMEYMTWLRDLMAGYQTGVPLTACNPAGDEQMMAAATKLDDTMPTLNSGFAHPFVRAFKRWAPEWPCLWTEAWMAWYQIWGLPRPWRSASNMTYCAARFFAEGGKGINYFLWHGGTNFGRDSMYLQTTQYEFGAALDEFGCRTLKYEMLSSLNKALVAHQDILAACDMPEASEILTDVGTRVFSHGGREIVFLFNDRDASTGNIEFEWREKTWSLPGRSILMLADNKETWRCSETDTPDPAKRVFVPTRAIKDAEWQESVECMPDEKDFIHTGQPREQLAFTKNKSDYAWYKSDISVSGNNPQKGVVTFHGINDFFQVFINGRCVAVSNGHLLEDRGPWDGEDYRQSFELELQPGLHQLAVLVCSLGLVKGDWQAGRRNMVEERKGFWGHASWRPNPGMAGDCVRIGDWHIHPELSGEVTRIAASGGRSAQWSPFRPELSGAPLRWYRLEFPTPPGDEPLAFDFGGLGKGLAWVNGECLGRYWTVNSVAPTIIHTEHNQVMNFFPPGEPSQRYYHLPREWLRERENTLLLFEETGGDPGGVELVQWLPESSQE